VTGNISISLVSSPRGTCNEADADGAPRLHNDNMMSRRTTNITATMIKKKTNQNTVVAIWLRISTLICSGVTKERRTMRGRAVIDAIKTIYEKQLQFVPCENFPFINAILPVIFF
jgi:uncharacterized membrane-anchored protein YjiN (DUF445 family)